VEIQLKETELCFVANAEQPAVKFAVFNGELKQRREGGLVLTSTPEHGGALNLTTLGRQSGKLGEP
jgi:hypothetical protein